MTVEDQPLLLVGAEVMTLDPAQPTARAVLIRRRRIAWVGDDPTPHLDGATVVDLHGTRIQPAFVNAHTHLTALGLGLGGVDLGVAQSVDDALAALRASLDSTPEHAVWGVGWDETSWPEHRAPSADEVSVATGGRPAMLTRSDGHCVVVDRTSLGALPLAYARGVDKGSDGLPTGLLRQEAAQVAQRWFTAQLSSSTLDQARVQAAKALAAAGVASAHEMGGPHRMGPDDFDAWISGTWPIEVIGYWGDLDLEFVTERGLRRAGGSLLLDGSIGAHSAALSSPYADKPGSGQLYRDTTELLEFTTQATRKGIQVALHAIGDRAVAQAIAVFDGAAAEVGQEQIRRSHHRLEYAALITEPQMARLVELGVVVTAHPANELDLASLGGSYEQRLGTERAHAANPLGRLARAGVALAFGSDHHDALDPLVSVRSATVHHDPESRMDPHDALVAATIGGRHAARQPTVGPIRAGNRADIAAFQLNSSGQGGAGQDGAGQDGEGQDRAVEGVDVLGSCVLTTVAGVIAHGRELIGS